MPAFCMHTWGTCPGLAGPHRCNGIVVVTMQHVKPHVHRCGNCPATQEEK
jgi:hypothetical protein